MITVKGLGAEMKGHKKIIFIFTIVTLCAGLVQMQRLGYLNPKANKYFTEATSVVISEETENKISSGNKQIDTLIIYDVQDEKSVEYMHSMSKNLKYMKVECQSIDIDEAYNTNYYEYERIIFLVGDLENRAGTELYNIIEYIENGGNLLWGIVPQNISNEFTYIQEKLGITSVEEYLTVDGMKFVENIIPSSKGRSFLDEEAFSDSCLNIKLDEESKVYIESAGEEEGIPILWQRDLGQGNIVFYNASTLGGDYYGGVFAGAICLLEKDFMYPVINAKVIFIDDFPAPHYNSDSDVIKSVYNRSVREFFRDIWWPDMQKAAGTYDAIYTGLFISTYNDIVNPEEFVFEDDPMMEYYGKSLLKNNYEIGLHGYNHQSLAPEGFLPAEIGYKPWGSQEDMEASLVTLRDYMNEMFPGCVFGSYVPPSNYLSEEGRAALSNALPDLKVISGLYSNAEDDIGAYVQDFGIAEDGIVEFPRITSGMWYEDSIIFEYLNGLALHGVFSHFIHPDDILDEERGRGEKWDTLFNGYSQILEDVNDSYPGIRALKAVEAADAVKVSEELEVNIQYEENMIYGECNNFHGEAFFFLRTDKKPKTIDESCTIEAVGESDYYMVTAKEPIFSIELE